MKIVCIDTQILSFGLVKTPPKGNEHLVDAAVNFLNWVDEQGFTVILPTIVIGELLIPIPNELHVEILRQLTKDWRIVEFDLASAQQFAIMRRQHIIKNKLHHMTDPNKPGATRAALKADVMIIATAIASNANLIYSHNDDMLKLCEGFIDAKNFLDENVQ